MSDMPDMPLPICKVFPDFVRLKHGKKYGSPLYIGGAYFLKRFCAHIVKC